MMQTPLFPHNQPQAKVAPEALNFSSSLELTLKDSTDLLQTLQSFAEQRSNFISTLTAEFKDKLGTSTLDQGRAKSLSFNTIWLVDELSSNALYYGLFGLNGELRESLIALQRLLKCDESGEATLEAASRFISKLGGEPQNFTSKEEASAAVNEELGKFFLANDRIGKTMRASAAINNGNLVLSIFEPSGFDQLKTWNDADAEALVTETNLESIGGRGIFVSHAFFKESKGCRASDCGQLGSIEVTCPLVAA